MTSPGKRHVVPFPELPEPGPFSGPGGDSSLDFSDTKFCGEGKLDNSGRMVYSAIAFRGVLYRSGMNVRLAGPGEEYVLKLKRFFQENGQAMCTGEWYFSRKNLKSEQGQDPPPRSKATAKFSKQEQEKELFASKMVDANPMSTVIGRALVISSHLWKSKPEYSSYPFIYYVEANYNAVDKSFHSVNQGSWRPDTSATVSKILESINSASARPHVSSSDETIEESGNSAARKSGAIPSQSPAISKKSPGRKSSGHPATPSRAPLRRVVETAINRSKELESLSAREAILREEEELQKKAMRARRRTTMNEKATGKPAKDASYVELDPEFLKGWKGGPVTFKELLSPRRITERPTLSPIATENAFRAYPKQRAEAFASLFTERALALSENEPARKRLRTLQVTLGMMESSLPQVRKLDNRRAEMDKEDLETFLEVSYQRAAETFT